MYPDQRVASFVEEQFVPVRFHVKEQPEAFGKYDAQWTPTIQIRDSGGTERHRIEGFLPADEFLTQLRLGLAHVAFGRGDFEEAERLFGEVAESNDEEAAPEAVYWSGVAQYKRTSDAGALNATHRKLSERWGKSAWAKKSSVWA